MVEQMVGCEFEGVAGYGENERKTRRQQERKMAGSCLLYNELHYNGLMTDLGLSPSSSSPHHVPLVSVPMLSPLCVAAHFSPLLALIPLRPTLQKRPRYSRKSPTFFRKSPTFFGKSPTFFGKAPTFSELSPMFGRKAPTPQASSPALPHLPPRP